MAIKIIHWDDRLLKDLLKSWHVPHHAASTSESPCRKKTLVKFIHAAKTCKNNSKDWSTTSTIIWVRDKLLVHPKVGWMSLFGMQWHLGQTLLLGIILGIVWVGGPRSVLQWCQPQDPLKTTWVIPNLVRYCHIFRFIYNILSISCFYHVQKLKTFQKNWGKRWKIFKHLQSVWRSPPFGNIILACYNNAGKSMPQACPPTTSRRLYCRRKPEQQP